MKPNFRNLFMKKLTRDRVVPIISEGLLTHLGDHSLLLTFLPEMSKQQQYSGQSFLTGIEKLVN
jgi:hypothetical protein